ncbi:P-loop containing nucleoside triphosphate hydrolase protein, partial [Panaeolus papilionaceus]
MLSAKDLHKIDVQLKKVLQDPQSHPFGGLNMIFCGDFAQLPPAIGGESKSLYSHTIGAHSSDPKSQEDAFGKSLWHQITTVVILRQNMRQRSQTVEDTKLRTALENMRYKVCTPEDIAFLLSCISCNLKGWPSVCDDRFRNEPIITSTNIVKDVINQLGCQRFADETKQTLIDFFSEDSERVKPPVSEKGLKGNQGKQQLKSIPDATQSILWDQPPSFTDCHIAGKLSLCIGLPVMIRYNYATELCMTRGQEGYVVSWQSRLGTKGQKVLDIVFVRLKNPPTNVNIEGLPTNVVPIYPKTNSISTLLPNGDTILLQRQQVELLPNFAMTVYASQGKTRPDNPVHLLGLTSHQAYYTALSRSASAAGTVIIDGLDITQITGGCSGALRQ